MIASETPFKNGGDLSIEFGSDREVLLELPEGTIGKGWKLVPVAKPKVIDHNWKNYTHAFSNLAHLHAHLNIVC